MADPGRIADNKRKIILDMTEAALRLITESRGYNTQPFVTTDPDLEVTPDLAQHVIYLHGGDDDISEQQVGPRFLVTFELLIAGYAHRGDGDPQTELAKLLQDVRTAICGSIAAVASETRSINFEMGGCSTTEGTMLGEGILGFVLPVRWQYWSGPVW